MSKLLQIRANSPKPKYIYIEFFRTFAVFIVFMYHLSIPGFNYGFLGVDIFFVISGFLMHRIYSNIYENQKILNFFAKRAKRLLPAYFLVNAMFLVFGILRLFPFERIQMFKQTFFNLTLVPNFYYWNQEQYFTSNSFRPFLNFWSLGVEIQFYLFFPLVSYLIFKRKYRVMVFFSFLSLISASILSFVSPTSQFFLMPFRIWEFMAGVFASIINSRISQNSFLKNLSFLFLFLSVISIFIPNVTDLFSANIFLNVLSVTSISIFLIMNASGSVENRFLYNTFSHLGAYSYAIYLIHFPLIIMFTYEPFSGNRLNPKLSVSILIFFLTLIIAICVYHFFEMPNRYRNRRSSFLSYFLSLLILAFLVNVSTPFAMKLGGIGFSKISQNISFSSLDRGEFRCGVLYKFTYLKSFGIIKDVCLISKKPGSAHALLIGNSHADSIKSPLATFLGELDIDLSLVQENVNVNENNVISLRSILLKGNYQYLIIHSRASTYDLTSLQKLLVTSKSLKIEVFLVMPVPEFVDSVPNSLLNRRSFFSQLTLKDFENSNQSEFSKLRLLAEKYDVNIVESDSIFCNPKCIIADKYFHPYYIDNNHLTLSGAKFLVNGIKFDLVRKIKS